MYDACLLSIFPFLWGSRECPLRSFSLYFCIQNYVQLECSPHRNIITLFSVIIYPSKLILGMLFLAFKQYYTIVLDNSINRLMFFSLTFLLKGQDMCILDIFKIQDEVITPFLHNQ